MAVLNRIYIPLLAGMFSLSSVLAAAEPVILPLTLEKATLFLRGAELHNSGQLSLPAGESKVILRGVAQNIDLQSLSISTSQDVIIQSVNLQSNYLEAELPEKVKQLKQQIEQAQQERRSVEIRHNVAEEQLNQLKDRRIWGGENAQPSLEQASATLQYIKKQMTGLLEEQVTYQKQLQTYDLLLQKLNRQYEEESRNISNQNTEIVVTFLSQTPVSSALAVSYMTPDAGWIPAYDIRVKDLTSPLVFTFKADVYQQSGFNWDKTKLTLSSANPRSGITPPALSPWYLQQLSNKNLEGQALPPMTTPAPTMVFEARLDMKRDMRQTKGVSDFIVVDNAGVNLTYNIDLPYSLPSSSQPRSVVIRQTELSADFHYVAFPKLDEKAFLQAKVKAWDELNLLAGKASIYFADSYVGTQLIQPERINETLDIALGPDKHIVVQRENNLNLKKQPSFIGNTVTESLAYQIKVQNLRKERVSLSVYDQIPVSQDSTIVIGDVNQGKGILEAKTGQVEWKLDLEPGQKMELPLSFTVKYPENSKVIGL